MLGVLVEMLSFAFMRRALLAGLCVGLLAPLVGAFLVHRRMAFVGDTLAHTSFAGVAVGLYVGATTSVAVSPYLTALVVATLSALGIQLLVERTDDDPDVSMAIVLAAGFALGTVLVSATDGGISVGVKAYLFGSLSVVTPTHLRWLLGLTVLVVGVVAVAYRQLAFATVDETGARVAGVNVTRLNRLLAVLTAVVVVGAMQILGVILVAAMLVVPVAAATQVAASFRGSIVWAVGIAELAVVVGLTLSYTYGLAAGGTVVLVAVGLYALAAAVGRPLRRRLAARRPSLRDVGDGRVR